jgi:hypothetical protein
MLEIKVVSKIRVKKKEDLRGDAELQPFDAVVTEAPMI